MTAKQKSQLHRIGEHFSDFQKNGQGYVALCPLHGDSTPSLSIREGLGGRVLVNCHAGCRTEDLLSVVGLRMADLMPGAKEPWNIVAKYDYRDRRGKLLYQSLRLDPKDFRCRRPDGKGGWFWKGVFDGVGRVLYRLPELLKANRDVPVFVVEGEKDADRLASIGGLVATTNVGGAGKWSLTDSRPLRGRRVVVLPDNDPTGQEHARDVAATLRDVAASVKILELPGLPEKGDVSDWLDNGGTVKRLRQLEKRTRRVNVGLPDTSGEVTSRRPVESVEKVAPFPVDVFPKPLRRFVCSIAEALPCPPDFPGAMLLGVLSAFIGRKRCIEVKSSWVEYPVLWIACVARSGDRKTPAFEKVTDPLRRLQRELLAQFKKEMKDYQSLSLKEQAKKQRPRLKQILTTDTTVEALKDVLAGNANGIIYPADELSGFSRSMCQYKAGRGDDRQHWLSIWSGVQIVCNRKGAEPIIIDDPFVSVTGGIQPDALGDLIDDGREDGFAARILFAYPDPIPSKDWTEDTIESCGRYEEVCRTLWNLQPSPEPITFSAAAKAVWIGWVNKHRKEAAPDNLRPSWSKAEGYCARLTLVLFLSRQACRETKGEQIDEPSIRGAIKLIDYFKSHARRIYGCMAVQKDTGRIGNALRWVKRHGGTVTARQANQYGLAKDSDAAKTLFKDLAELGHGTVTEESRGSVVFRFYASTGLQDDRTKVK